MSYWHQKFAEKYPDTVVVEFELYFNVGIFWEFSPNNVRLKSYRTSVNMFEGVSFVGQDVAQNVVLLQVNKTNESEVL